MEQLESARFSQFLGTLRVTPVKRPKRTLYVIKSVSNFACQLIATCDRPQNLKKIGDVRHLYCTFSVERAINIQR